MDQWVWGMEGSAFSPKDLTLVVTYKPRIVEKRVLADLSTIYRNKSPLEWVPYSVYTSLVVLEWFQLAIASQTWCVEEKVVWCSNLAFGRAGLFGRLCARFCARPSGPNHPGETSLLPSSPTTYQIRQRVRLSMSTRAAGDAERPACVSW